MAGGINRVGNQDSLKTVSMFGGDDASAVPYQDLIAAFMKENPHLVVEDSSEISTEEWKSSVIESFQSPETTPDVLFYFTGADVRNLILNGQLVSIEEIQESYPEYGNTIRGSTMNFMKEFDGSHYALPVRGFWEGLFCNKDLFDQYGLSLPTDWPSLMSAIEVFSENGVTPIAASLKEVPHYWIEHLILSEGGAVEHRLNPKDYQPESWIKGLAWFQTLFEASAFPVDTTTITNADSAALFVEKKAAMALDGSWFANSINDTENTVVLPFPVVPEGKMKEGDIISGFSSGFYITRQAWEQPKKREAAVKFVNYMTTVDSIAKICSSGEAPAADIPQSSDLSPLQSSTALLQQNAGEACMPIDSKLHKDAWKYLCAQIPLVAEDKISAAKVVEKLSQLNQWKTN